jgi:hypothetical protein
VWDTGTRRVLAEAVYRDVAKLSDIDHLCAGAEGRLLAADSQRLVVFRVVEGEEGLRPLATVEIGNIQCMVPVTQGRVACMTFGRYGSGGGTRVVDGSTGKILQVG